MSKFKLAMIVTMIGRVAQLVANKDVGTTGIASRLKRLANFGNCFYNSLSLFNSDISSFVSTCFFGHVSSFVCYLFKVFVPEI